MPAHVHVRSLSRFGYSEQEMYEWATKYCTKNYFPGTKEHFACIQEYIGTLMPRDPNAKSPTTPIKTTTITTPTKTPGTPTPSAQNPPPPPPGGSGTLWKVLLAGAGVAGLVLYMGRRKSRKGKR